MKLYLIHQNEETGYDSYDSAVVCAEDEDGARNTHPSSRTGGSWDNAWGEWCSTPDKVTVEYLGEAKEGTTAGVICASFNAG